MICPACKRPMAREIRGTRERTEIIYWCVEAKCSEYRKEKRV